MDHNINTGNLEHRFGSINRLYGPKALPSLSSKHVIIVGIGGVGSWVAESLSRTGIGELTLIDWDDICMTNINRQVHALDNAIGRGKVDLMRERISHINPECKVNAIREYLNPDNAKELIHNNCNLVIDAIDKMTPKSHILANARRNKIRSITVGGAGGVRDFFSITSSDLLFTKNDKLLALVRRNLKRDFGFRKYTKKFKIDAVYSNELKVFPNENMIPSCEKPTTKEKGIGCHHGYGSAAHITAGFGMAVCSLALRRLLQKE